MITLSRVLAPRLKEVRNQSSAVREALKDIAHDEDFQLIDYISQCMLAQHLRDKLSDK